MVNKGDDTETLTTEKLEEKIENGKKINRMILEIKAKKTLYDNSVEKEITLTKNHEELTEEIEERRIDKAKIVAEADLPVDSISFENDYLTINNFKFDENQVCESDAVLLLANILAKINPGPIQVIGDASILDANKLEELYKIAEVNNKIMFVDEVVRDASEMVVVGYDTISKIPTKNVKTTKNTKVGSAKTKQSDSKNEIPDLKKKDQDNISKNDNKPLF